MATALAVGLGVAVTAFLVCAEPKQTVFKGLGLNLTLISISRAELACLPCEDTDTAQQLQGDSAELSIKAVSRAG